MLRWKHLIDFDFYQNYRQRYTVIPITTVRGPLTLNTNILNIVRFRYRNLRNTKNIFIAKIKKYIFFGISIF